MGPVFGSVTVFDRAAGCRGGGKVGILLSAFHFPTAHSLPILVFSFPILEPVVGAVGMWESRVLGETSKESWKEGGLSGMSCVLIRGHHSAHSRRSGAAAPGRTKVEKLLDPFCGIDFPRIDVALTVHAHLM